MKPGKMLIEEGLDVLFYPSFVYEKELYSEGFQALPICPFVRTNVH